MIKVAIVEDVQSEADSLKSCLSEYSKTHDVEFFIDHFTSAEKFLKSYNSSFDIIFMDIELPGNDGFVSSMKLREIDSDVVLVFVTHLSNYAIQGYEVNAYDYVLKPVLYDSFEIKMDRLLNRLNSRKKVRIEVRDADRRLHVITADRLLFVEVLDHNLIFHTEDQDLYTRGSLKSIEDVLLQNHFAKPNNYSLVNLRFVTNINFDTIILKDKEVRISRARKKEFLQSLSIYLGEVS